MIDATYQPQSEILVLYHSSTCYWLVKILAVYPVVREKSGKFQEKIREKSGNIDSSQGKVKFSRKVREKSGNFMVMAV